MSCESNQSLNLIIDKDASPKEDALKTDPAEQLYENVGTARGSETGTAKILVTEDGHEASPKRAAIPKD